MRPNLRSPPRALFPHITTTKYLISLPHVCVFCQNEIVVKIYERIPFRDLVQHPLSPLFLNGATKDIPLNLFSNTHLHLLRCLVPSPVMRLWADVSACGGIKFNSSSPVLPVPFICPNIFMSLIWCHPLTWLHPAKESQSPIPFFCFPCHHCK